MNEWVPGLSDVILEQSKFANSVAVPGVPLASGDERLNLTVRLGAKCARFAQLMVCRRVTSRLTLEPRA